jgi:hypothetical protein
MTFMDDEEATEGHRCSTRPETDLSEGNASRHYTEDFRRSTAPDQVDLWVDPVTGEPTVLP